jgi:hypothetical protein
MKEQDCGQRIIRRCIVPGVDSDSVRCTQGDPPRLGIVSVTGNRAGEQYGKKFTPGKAPAAGGLPGQVSMGHVGLHYRP